MFAEFNPAHRAVDILAHTGIIKVDLISNSISLTSSLFKEWYFQNVETESKMKEQEINNSPKRREYMDILSLVTTTTIPAVIKFLFDQMGKLTNRLNEKELEKIQEAKEKLQQMDNEEDMADIQALVNEISVLVPDGNEIASLQSLKKWVREQLAADYADLPALGDLLGNILEQLRENEQNDMKKKELLTMTIALNEDSKELRSLMRMGDDTKEDRRKLSQRIALSVEMLL